MGGRVLIIDDDANLIAGLRRQLRGRYDLATAVGGEEGLAAISAEQPIAVVVCDMRMPGMDGIEVLKRFRQRAPETVRMMLTGNADQQTAIDAINEGAIFRFFTKPCAVETLTAGIDAGLEQHRLVTAERDLLEKTLSGSVKVLMGVLSLGDPLAYGRASRMRDWVRRIAAPLGVKAHWQLEIAAMLAPIGLVSLPAETLAALRAGEALSPEEKAMVARVPQAAHDLIANIPRLRPVAEVVLLQNKGYDGSGYPEDDGRTRSDLPEHARVLKILTDLSVLTDGPTVPRGAFDRLYDSPEKYDPRLLADIRRVLEDSPSSSQAAVTYARVPVHLLMPGDYLRSDLTLENGKLILAKGVQLTEAQVARLRNLVKIHKFREPLDVARSL